MSWLENPYIVRPRIHEETNVLAAPIERIQDGKGCRDKDDLEDCVRSRVESNMYNSSFAMQFCGPTARGAAVDAFGNCTIPQVRINPCQKRSRHGDDTQRTFSHTKKDFTIC